MKVRVYSLLKLVIEFSTVEIVEVTSGYQTAWTLNGSVYAVACWPIITGNERRYLRREILRGHMKTLCILTNGGDTCALNASIKSVRDNAYKAGYRKIYGALRGYQGLLDGAMEDITHREIDVTIGGSFLGSMRTSPTEKKDGKYTVKNELAEKMAQTLGDFSVDVLIVIGGDGTLQATSQFQSWIAARKLERPIHSFNMLGFLKTIDNDIRTYTHYEGISIALCPGFPSAVKKIVSTVEDLRVTSRTAQRAFCVETMGRDAGWLAAAGAIGGAEVILVPELAKRLEIELKLSGRELTNEIWHRIANRVALFYRQNRNVIITIAEGFRPPGKIEGMEEFEKSIKDLFGPRKRVGATELIASTLSPALELYFWCLNNIVINEKDDEPRIREKIRKALDQDTDIHEKYNELSENHPLKQWDIAKMLLSLYEIDVVKKNQTLFFGSVPYKFEIRPHRTDYVPRSGPPSSYDYRLATVFGRKIGHLLVNKEFGVVPCLSEVVPYLKLDLDVVTTVPIEEIRTFYYDQEDYYDISKLANKDRITNFLMTIMTGPSLEEALEADRMNADVV